MDQHGNPVEGVLVRSNIQPGNAYFFNSKTTVEYTDEEGRVVLPAGSWFQINKVKKEGYQFRPLAQFNRQFGNSTLGKSAKRFDRKNPLVIKGWKRGEQPDLTYVGGRVFFPDDVEQCTLTLVEPSSSNGLEEAVKLNFKVKSKFERDPDTINPDQKYVAQKWKAWFRLIDAKLKDTDNLFMNRASDNGDYRSVLEYPYNPFANHVHEERKVYIKGEESEFYGGGLFFIKADRGTKPSLDAVNKQGMAFQVWFNFDGSRNVMRDHAHTTWSITSGWLDEKYYCEEAPKEF